MAPTPTPPPPPMQSSSPGKDAKGDSDQEPQQLLQQQVNTFYVFFYKFIINLMISTLK